MNHPKMVPKGLVISVKTPKKDINTAIIIIMKISTLILNCFFLRYPNETVAAVIKSFNKFIAIAKNTSPVNIRTIGRTIPKPV